ncbi:MAG TPA: hypothetical protein PLP33_09735 [Leptospiraceae bacterium]|nr:hypothetical protein [Leptospiraceae bacterium]HMY31815.1 hypothetical protein [Leptospiraceae bacterium]HNC55713.1 hypothetical protein [Leptospiraceae bacterium]HNE07901.1 hypothetical protein [Leptospiraceae bacterium]HNH02524.1 hypothetical protein [Leptospiraceae bacterium]
MSRVFVNKLLSILLVSYLFNFGLFSQAASDNYVEVFKGQRVQQGELFYNKALDFYKDSNYKACIDKLNEFLFLFPGHPATLKSLKLLSLTYKKRDLIDESIRTDLLIYKENPTTEDGLTSYLDAGKKLLMIGRAKEGKNILENIKNQLYSSKIAKDAEIELKQNKILEENGFQIKEEMSKD